MAKGELDRVPLRLHPDTYERVKYWAKKKGVSANTYLSEAVESQIARENGDYDLPALEIARLNQLVDEIRALSTNVGSLESVVITMSGSLLGLAKGENYLMDENEDGELDLA